MSVDIPAGLIETVNRMVRASRQLLHQLGREPTPEKLADKLAMPLEKVQKLLAIAPRPVTLASLTNPR
jgi:RNA polymerase primary sigma factor